MKSGYSVVQHAVVEGGVRTVDLSTYDIVRNRDGVLMNSEPLHVRAAERLALKLNRDKTLEKAAEMITETKTNQEVKIRWKKIGAGTFRMKDGKIIKQNQVFDACESEIPVAFRDVLVPVDPLPEEKPLEIVTATYRLVSKGPGWYDILDSQGKRVNEKSLRQPEAQKMLEDLMP